MQLHIVTLRQLVIRKFGALRFGSEMERAEPIVVVLSFSFFYFLLENATAYIIFNMKVLTGWKLSSGEMPDGGMNGIPKFHT